jgi:2-C-methyl-D-erythritol 4-phosphate cytidylyltransferase
MKKKFISVIIPAAGSGKRMNHSEPKQYMKLFGKTILEHTLTIFQSHSEISEIILVAPSSDINHLTTYTDLFPKIIAITPGGKERQDSVNNGLKKVTEHSDIVLVHDAARPLVQNDDISRIIDALENYDVVALAVPVKETIKLVNNEMKVIKTPKRELLWSIQTPQGMKANLMKKLYQDIASTNFLGTDEAMVAEHYGYEVFIAQGNYQNIKITSPEDLILAEIIMKGRDAI